MDLRSRLLRGAIAGAAGTLALDVAAYGDMLVRGRPASDIPATAAAKTAGLLGIDLEGDDVRSNSRRSALGALLGYGTGVAVGVAYAVVRPRGPVRPLAEGLAVGAAAMVAANVPLTAQGLTDPRSWGIAGWLADVVPHAAYGVVVAASLRLLAGRD